VYQIGSPANILCKLRKYIKMNCLKNNSFLLIKDAAAGSSGDWAKAIANIKYSVSLELRPAQTGSDSKYGFTLPEDSNLTIKKNTFSMQFISFSCYFYSLRSSFSWRGDIHRP
jgi:hypothetical protein